MRGELYQKMLYHIYCHILYEFDLYKTTIMYVVLAFTHPSLEWNPCVQQIRPCT